jgi:glycosyltransferase involved in cell wall biosynthesis
LPPQEKLANRERGEDEDGKEVEAPEPIGKRLSLNAGIARATAPIVVFQDADLEYAPAALEVLLGPIERGEADAVYGSRFLCSRSQATGPLHRAGNWLLTWLSNRFTGLRLTDMETGQKAFRREVIQALDLVEERFGIEPEITAKLARAGCRIVEVPVDYTGRSRAAGKKIGLRDALWAIVCIIRYSR